jgi:type IV pilus assembly protein PilC
MPWIFYSVVTPDGDIAYRKGHFDSLEILDAQLTRRGEMIDKFIELPDFLYQLHQMSLGHLSDRDVAAFCSMLSMYVSGGVDLQSALTDMGNQAKTPAYRNTINALRQALANGYSLSQALKMTGQFPEEVLAMARIGEESGNLDRVMNDAAEHIERVAAIKSATRRALIYPGFTLLVILGAAMFWLTFVVPKVAEVFKSINIALPATTMALVSASDRARQYWWLILMVLIILPVIFFILRRNEKFRYETDRLGWHLPILGNIVRGSQTAFYFQYLNLMYGAGITITQALELMTNAVQNRYFRSRVSKIIDKLRSGLPLVQAVEHAGIFEPLALRMIGIGEQTGNLEVQLKKLGDIYFARVNALVDVLSKVLEPVLIIVMAALLGFFVIAVIGPIYGAIGSIGK